MLELSILAAFGLWGWQRNDGLLRFLLAVGLPLLAALLWGTFRIPNDPGKAPVAIPGVLRLGLELALFVLAVLALLDAGYTTIGWGLGIVVLIHYAISYDRIQWMISR